MASFFDIESDFINKLKQKGHYYDKINHFFMFDLYQLFVVARYELTYEQDMNVFDPSRYVGLRQIYKRMRHHVACNIADYSRKLFTLICLYVLLMYLTITKINTLSPAWLPQAKEYAVPDHMVPLMRGLFNIFMIEICVSIVVTILFFNFILYFIRRLSEYKRMRTIIDENIE